MIFPLSSSRINPITFSFFPLGNGLSNSQFEVPNVVSTSSAMFCKYHLLLYIK